MKNKMGKDVMRVIAIVAAFMLLYAMLKAIELIAVVSSGDWTIIGLLVSTTTIGVISAVSFYILMYAKKHLKPIENTTED